MRKELDARLEAARLRGDDCIVNVDLTHAAVVHRKTRRQWYIVETGASNRGGRYEVYACPIELVEFVALCDAIPR